MLTLLAAGAAILSLSSKAFAQETYASTDYTDTNTGISFQRYFENAQATGGYSFGIALPQNPTTDFIGQLVVPLNSTQGWGAVSLGGSMTGSLLFAVWANGQDVVPTFRMATAYASPDVYSGNATTSPIAKGTFVNTTHLSYTFVCGNCILGNLQTFASTDAQYTLGYAVSGTNPTDPTDSASELSYHAEAYGEYSMALSNATSADYDMWAAMASAATTGSCNGTSSTGSATATVSSGATIPVSTGTSSVPSGPLSTSATTYDIIVVGGGPSGIIAAERLAEAGNNVLLLERGGPSNTALGATDTLSWNDTLTPYDLPALGSSLTTMQDVSEFCKDTASTAGCILGGSSTVNAMNFIHPPERDFDDKWPTGWKWADVSDAADRLYSRNPGTTMPSADGKHYDQTAFNIVSSILSINGWTQVDSIQSPNEKTKAFSQPAWSIMNSKRAGPARTYLPLAQALPNFTLKMDTKVTNLVRTGGRITGVQTVASNGTAEIININPTGKVVLASGALSTPRVLWNSGIGKSDMLQVVQSGSSGITLPSESDWIDLPVGHNMKDHAQYVLQFNSLQNFSAYPYSQIPSGPPVSDQDLYAAGSGVLAQAVQRLHMWTSDTTASDGLTRYLQGTVSAMTSGVITIKGFLTHGTTSTGVLGINAAGNTIVQTAPWMNTPGDRQVMTTFLQWILDTMAKNGTLSYSGGTTNASSLIDSRITGDHWTGTAKMGPDDGRLANGTSVVDLDTRVYGTDNLFVVDASMHPDLPTGNTQAIIMVAAEQAAAKIAAFQVAPSNLTTTPSSGASAPPFANTTLSTSAGALPATALGVAAATSGSGSVSSKTACGRKPTGAAVASSGFSTISIPSPTSVSMPSTPPSSAGEDSGAGSTGEQSSMNQLIDLIMQLIQDLLGKGEDGSS
ncbi:MAG: hypothetical protein Q9227_008981 [Pyrenula ochraceoflavens]